MTHGGQLRANWVVNFDAKRARASGFDKFSSSEAEHASAHEIASKIRALFTEHGFPDPVYADSGNGAHLLYRTEPSDPKASTDLIARVLSRLARDFGTVIDTTVSNPARFTKVYGTL